jgi:hypothetical protein
VERWETGGRYEKKHDFHTKGKIFDVHNAQIAYIRTEMNE